MAEKKDTKKKTKATAKKKAAAKTVKAAAKTTVKKAAKPKAPAKAAAKKATTKKAAPKKTAAPKKAARKVTKAAAGKAPKKTGKKAPVEHAKEVLTEAAQEVIQEQPQAVVAQAPVEAAPAAEEKAAEEAAELQARETAERKAKEEADRKAEEAAERKAREAAERKAKEETDRKARAEQDRTGKEEAAKAAKAAAPKPAGKPVAPGRSVPRLKEKYERTAVPALMKEFQYKSAMQAPRLKKVTLNVGMGEAINDVKMLDRAVEELGQVTGQRPVVTRAKKSIATYKLRTGMPIGCMVTLRRERMYEFLDRLISAALPRIRDFRGISPKSFDGRGNYSMGIREQIIFPEIDIDKIGAIHGLDIAIVTTAQTDEEGKALLRHLGMPFRK